MDTLFLSPLEISKAISKIGEKKASATIFELFVYGILAGTYIAFGSHFFTMFDNLIPVTIGNIIGGLLIVLLHPKIEERITRLLMRKKRDFS